MAALVDTLERWAQTGECVTVVFEQPPAPPIESAAITVSYARRAYPNSADDEIVRLVQASERPHDITVATSDLVLCERIRAAGAAVYPAAGFRALIEPG